jgi:26S proteasome regulatory subunit N3
VQKLGEAPKTMPAERRSLRSNKSETSSSPNGEKPRSDSQSSSNKKDRPTHTRSASSRSKSLASKKGVTTAKDMSGDIPPTNGTDPLENGVNGTDDIEMEDESSKSTGRTKSVKDKDGDEEMTVVVPPPKATKLAGVPQKDDDGDIAMNGTVDVEVNESAESAEDPKTKTITGMLMVVQFSVFHPLFGEVKLITGLFQRYQK